MFGLNFSICSICDIQDAYFLNPLTHFHLFFVAVAPALTTLPTNQTVTEGNTATFYCSASGIPSPAITWIKDERVVGRGEILTIETRKDHSGEYLCVADNGLSDTANASAYLDVQCKYETILWKKTKICKTSVK